MATGQELTPGQNARSRGEESKHAMATGQELTPGQNASLDIMINKFSHKPMSNLWKKKLGYKFISATLFNIGKIKWNIILPIY